jgi:hypothetical protein
MDRIIERQDNKLQYGNINVQKNSYRMYINKVVTVYLTTKKRENSKCFVIEKIAERLEYTG